MHSDLPQSAIEFAYGQCIVKVLRIMRVYGTGKDIAEVLSAVYLLLRYHVANLVGSIFHRLRIFIRQTVLSQNSIHLSVIFAAFTENIDYFCHYITTLAVRP